MWLALVALVALTAACARIDIGIDVAEDGLATLEFDVIADDMTDGLSTEDLEPYLDQAVPGMTMEVIERDGRGGFRVTFENFPTEGLSTLFTRGGSPVESYPLFESFSVEQVSEQMWTFDAVARDTFDVYTESVASVPVGTEIPAWDGVWENADDGVYLTMSLPGVVAETNAPESGHDSATWALHEMSAGEQLMMVSEPEGFPTRMQLYIGAGILAFILLLVVVSLIKRSRRKKAARERAESRAEYQASMMAPAPWQEPGTGSFGAPGGVPSLSGHGAAADPNSVTFDPGTGRPLKGTGLAPRTLAETLATPESPLVAPLAPGGMPALPPAPPVEPEQWAPPTAAQIVEPAAPVAQPEPVAPPEPPAQPAAGWYPDPYGHATHRWWTGSEWSEHTS